MENNRNANKLPNRPIMSNPTLNIGGMSVYCVPSCPACNEPTYGEPECPFCGQPFIYDDAEESDALLFGLPDAIVCPHCGENATINLHTEQGELIDYFYECSCGHMFEDAKGLSGYNYLRTEKFHGFTVALKALVSRDSEVEVQKNERT